MKGTSFLITYGKRNLCAFEWTVKAGSMYDTIPGTSHFLEHLIASEYTEDEKAFERKLKRRGIHGNAWTNFQEVYYFYPEFYFEKDILEGIIKKYGNTLRTYFKEDDENKSRNGIAVLNRRAKKEVEIIKAEIERGLTLDHRLRESWFYLTRVKDFNTNTLGTIEDVESLRGSHFLEHMKKYYNKNNITFVLGLPESERPNEAYWRELVQKEIIGNLPDGKYYNEYFPYEFEDGYILPAEADNVSLVFDTDLPPLYSRLEDTFYRALFRTVLSRVLFEKIRDRDNLSYDPNCFVNPETGPGAFYVTATTDKNNFIKVIGIVERILDNFRFTEEDIEGWKLNLRNKAERNRISSRYVYNDLMWNFYNKEWLKEDNYFNMSDEKFYKIIEDSLKKINLVNATKWYNYVFPQIEKTLAVLCGEKTSLEEIETFVEGVEKSMRDRYEKPVKKTRHPNNGKKKPHGNKKVTNTNFKVNKAKKLNKK